MDTTKKFEKLLSIWAGIEDEWRRCNPESVKILAALKKQPFLPPAREDEILQAESIFGVKFPIDYFLSLKVHNGASCFASLWDGVDILSLDEVLGRRSLLKRFARPGRQMENPGFYNVKGAVRPMAFNDKWIPFAEQEKRYLFIDMDPSQGGVVGQICSNDMECRAIQVLAGSYYEFLENGFHKMTTIVVL